MAVLKFDKVPYEVVREGLKRKIIHKKELMTVLLDFTDGPYWIAFVMCSGNGATNLILSAPIKTSASNFDAEKKRV